LLNGGDIQPGNRDAAVIIEPNDHPAASRIQTHMISRGNWIPRTTRGHNRERLKRCHSEMLPDIPSHEETLSIRFGSGKRLNGGPRSLSAALQPQRWANQIKVFMMLPHAKTLRTPRNILTSAELSKKDRPIQKHPPARSFSKRNPERAERGGILDTCRQSWQVSIEAFKGK
jgi:hypothetical protein